MRDQVNNFKTTKSHSILDRSVSIARYLGGIEPSRKVSATLYISCYFSAYIHVLVPYARMGLGTSPLYVVTSTLHSEPLVSVIQTGHYVAILVVVDFWWGLAIYTLGGVCRKFSPGIVPLPTTTNHHPPFVRVSTTETSEPY